MCVYNIYIYIYIEREREIVQEIVVVRIGGDAECGRVHSSSAPKGNGIGASNNNDNVHLFCEYTTNDNNNNNNNNDDNNVINIKGV